MAHMHTSGYRRIAKRKYAGHKLAVTSSGLGWIMEHRLIWWEAHPEDHEALLSGATVHHKNGVRDDNRLENLEIRYEGNHPQGWLLSDVPDEKMEIEMKRRGYVTYKKV